MTKSLVILRNREQSSMASAWTELLCLGFGASKPYKLYLGTYEVLGECAEFYDESLDENVVPSSIADEAVQGAKDDYVIGYNVVSDGYGDDDELEFSFPMECERWLVEKNWLDDTLLVDVEAGMSLLGEPQIGIHKPDSPASDF